jgi:hypothetical protein
MSSCTEKLWSMVPVGAAWTESMKLGGELHEKAREEYLCDLRMKNNELAEQLGLYSMQLHVTLEEMKALQVGGSKVSPPLSPLTLSKQEESARLKQELEAARLQLECYHKKENDELQQDSLAFEIWGSKKQPDATWDPAPSLLDDPILRKPLTVGRVVNELGLRCTAKNVHRLSAHVHQAYIRAHGKPPTPAVYYDNEGLPERVSCYTEEDRDLITEVVTMFGDH